MVSPIYDTRWTPTAGLGLSRVMSRSRIPSSRFHQCAGDALLQLQLWEMSVLMQDTVAMTRPKRSLTVIGDSETVKK